jgi:hypothetical protein
MLHHDLGLLVKQWQSMIDVVSLDGRSNFPEGVVEG